MNPSKPVAQIKKNKIKAIYSSAYAVIHQIADDADLYMPEEINLWNKERYDKLKAIFDRYGVTMTEPVQI